MHNLEVRKSCSYSFSSRCCSHNYSLLCQIAVGASSSMSGTQVSFILEWSQLAAAITEAMIQGIFVGSRAIDIP